MADLQYLQILNQEGYNWDDFLNWVDTELVESMLYVHIEIQNTENHIKRLRSHYFYLPLVLISLTNCLLSRYLHGLMDIIKDWDLQSKRQVKCNGQKVNVYTFTPKFTVRKLLLVENA